MLESLHAGEELQGRHLLRIADWSREELAHTLDLAAELKELQREREPHRLLEGRALGLVFDKPSTRTRISFEVGMGQLGGTALFLPADQLQLVRGESIRDTAASVSRYLDAIALRISSHEDLEEVAHHASIPVLNALTDVAHPCQALADLLTLREAFGRLDGLRVAYVGDGNNVARSLAVLGATAGVEVVVAAPEGFQLEPVAGARLERDPRAAVAGAHAVYTDVWVSMGDDEREADARRRALAPYRVDDALLDLAGPDVIALHCLPAHPGEEITADVLYGDRQRIWDQAENRRHAQKALMQWLLEG